MQRKRIFSGVQPTGALHLGSYLGAIRQWVLHQAENDNIFCVVDLHSLTIPEAVDPKVLLAKSREVAGLYLACGIDPDRCAVFIQSHVKEHSELAWILTCTTPLGWAEKMTQFKTKSEGRDSVSTGLLTYPILQAADILLYDATHIPVGEDQKQHIELARNIAQRFNNMFGEVFVLPTPSIPEVGARVMAFDDPESKMSKSTAVTKPGHAVSLLDDEKRIRKTIMSAVTDSGSEFEWDKASAGVRNLLAIHHALSGEPIASISGRFQGRGYGYLKQEVFELVWGAVKPIQERYTALTADPTQLDRVLDRSTARIRPIAEATMKRVRAAVGVG
jgi:tryptophanyl-tRNA synthetase